MTARSGFHALLQGLGALLPGDYLKTAFYLNAIAKPRVALRRALTAFYRMDHVYAVLQQVKRDYQGRFSILEFGTHDGYGFTKILYATKHLGMSDRVMVRAFDSFEGMPAPADRRDSNIIESGELFAPGQYRGRYEELDAYCRARYANYALHRGFFEASLTPDVLQVLEQDLPILIWIDCDYYSSSLTVFERVLPYLPSGCVVYFDDFELNYGSRLTGEARLVYELNHGSLGDGIELVLDRELSLDSQRVYRFVRF
ncbi:MAG: TylF/MycF/NovP-related O-methyltransferase, partial [Gemmatimonadales bacterium]